MRASIYQPQYFPRLHYINRVIDSDVFVLLSSAQYTRAMTHELPDGGRERRKTFQSHTPIKQHDGERLLTVPILSTGRRSSIAQCRTDGAQRWREQHLKALRAAYGRAPQFDHRFAEVEGLLAREPASLAELNTRTLYWALDVLLDLRVGVEQLALPAINDALAARSPVRLRRVVEDPELDVPRPSGEQQGGVWTARLCARLGASEYLYGATATSYMDQHEYAVRGVTPVLQRWEPMPYPQLFEDRVDFLPNLSVLDLLFNVAPADARWIVAPELTGARSAPAGGGAATAQHQRGGGPAVATPLHG